MTTPAGYFRIQFNSSGTWLSPTAGTFPGARTEDGYIVQYPKPTAVLPNGRSTGAYGYIEHVLRFGDGVSVTNYNYIISGFGGVSMDTQDVPIEVELIDPRAAPGSKWETWTGYADWPTAKAAPVGAFYNGVEMRLRLVVRT